MPTIKPRVQVTLEDQTHEVISRLAALQGRSRGSVIAELLDSVAPALGRTVSLLEAAIEAPRDVKKGLRQMVEGLHDEFLAISGESSKQLDMVLDQLSSGEVSEGANPHLVTRGSGIKPNTSPEKPKKPRKGSTTGV
jgi:hypothetical protein